MAGAKRADAVGSRLDQGLNRPSRNLSPHPFRVGGNRFDGGVANLPQALSCRLKAGLSVGQFMGIAALDARRRGEDEGLSQDEIAFYDALAESQSAVDVLGSDSLKLIAHELLKSLRGSVTVDWSHRETARARMRVLVKRILRKYGYPPDLQEAAVQTVLRQAEALSAKWAI
jgi:hypothetical protein